MNKDTKAYWPNNDDYIEDFQEVEFSIDQQESFDVVRAGITQGNLNDLIRRACENGGLPPGMKKWTEFELDFIEGVNSE